MTQITSVPVDHKEAHLNQKILGLRTYLARVFVFATLLIAGVLFITSFSLQIGQFEKDQLITYQRVQKLLLYSSEDAIIAEDLSLLSNVVKELGESDQSIALLSITNDEGKVLAEWRTPRSKDTDTLKLPPAIVEVGGRSQGSIHLVIDLSHQRAVIRSFVIKESLMATALLLLLLCLQMYLVNQIAVLPIHKIEERLLKVAEGDLDAQLNVTGASEFIKLSRSLNTVTHTLERQRRSEAEARQELELLNSAYVRFVPETFLKLLGKEHIVGVKLGDHARLNLTIMFTDIRSFTPLAESMTAEETFNFINDYFAHLGPIVRQYNGVIDKYIGDAIMALFVSPKDALDAGLAMLDTLEHFNIKRAHEKPIQMGIGLHTGVVMLGTIGEQFRMEGTVIGDAVNLAARLESLTKSYTVPLLISEETKVQIEEEVNHNTELYQVDFIDEVFAKGKSQATRIYAVEASLQHTETIKQNISGIKEIISGVYSQPNSQV